MKGAFINTKHLQNVIPSFSTKDFFRSVVAFSLKKRHRRQMFPDNSLNMSLRTASKGGKKSAY